MKKLIAIFVLLILAAGGTYWYYNYGKPKEKPQVVTAAVSRQDIVESVQTTGSLEALRTVQVGSQVSGTVAHLYADFNHIVSEGQTIADLDPKLLQVQVDIQTANYERQVGDIAQAEVQLENDRLNLKRQEQLFAKQLINQQQLEAAVLQVKSRDASILSSRKSLLQTNANLEAAKLNVKYCTIVSPVDGVIVDRKVDVGQTVQSSVNVAQFFVIATDLTNLKLTAGVDEADIGKIRSGMPVVFEVGTYGKQEFSGTVDSVRLNATNSNNVVTYPVWINVPNNDLKLRPSMTATIRIIISTAEAALRIPNGALRFKPNTETYLALGLTPPAAGQGGRTPAAGNAGNAAPGGRNQGGQGASGNPQADASQAPPATAPGAAPPAQGTPDAARAPGMTAPPAALGQQAQNQDQRMQGRGGQGTGGQQGGRGGQQGATRNRGFGAGATNTMQGMADFNRAGRGAGGRGGGGLGQAGGRGSGRGNQTPANAKGDTTPLNERLTASGAKAKKIDDLFQEPPRQTNPGFVYTWDEAKKELKQIRVTVGVTDGTFSELIAGEGIQQGQQLVTNVILPITVKPGAPNSNPFMGPQPGRGNPGGMTPGGGGAGGGGGGRGGGGGGGGRGGGN